MPGVGDLGQPPAGNYDASPARLRSLTLGELLDRFGASTPAPGGGSAAAVACALSAALVEMAAGLGDSAALAARAGELRMQALALAERDLDSYAPVLEARRLPHDDPRRPDAVSAALANAAQVPLATARSAAELASLADRAVGETRPAVAGDAAVAAVLAEAACAAATLLAEINLRDVPDADGEIRPAARRLAENALTDRDRAVERIYES